MIRINELCNHILTKADIDIETITDFNLDQAQLYGFSEAQECIIRILDTEIKFVPLSRTRITNMKNAFTPSKIIDILDR
jgi:hypothetical protein